MRIRPVLTNFTDTRPRNHIRERDRNESPATVAVHESRVTSAQKDNCFGVVGPTRKILAARSSLQVASRHRFAYHRNEPLG